MANNPQPFTVDQEHQFAGIVRIQAGDAFPDVFTVLALFGLDVSTNCTVSVGNCTAAGTERGVATLRGNGEGQDGAARRWQDLAPGGDSFKASRVSRAGLSGLVTSTTAKASLMGRWRVESKTWCPAAA